MKIAELFVDLGVKGQGQLDKTLKGTKDNVGALISSSLALKAALVGVAYAMQNMMGDSAKTGQGLENFTALTGMSAQNLQRWQYAARQVGVSNEEMAGSFKSVQNSITGMLLGGQGIGGYAMVANKVGLDEKRLRDTEYVMGQLQKFAQAVPQDVGNQMLKTFGLGEGTIAAMRRNAFNPKAFAAADVYSEKETKQLARVDAAMSNVMRKIEMSIGRFTARNGMQLVRDIGKITTAVIELAEALEKVATKFELWDRTAKTLTGFANALNLFTETIDTISAGKAAPGNKMVKKQNGEWVPGLSNSPLGQFLGMDRVLPEPKPQPVNKVNNTTVNQNLQFQHSGKDAQKTGESVNKAARDAIRTSQSQTQAN